MIKCSHVFHEDCIARHFAYQDEFLTPRSCPLCRTLLPDLLPPPKPVVLSAASSAAPKSAAPDESADGVAKGVAAVAKGVAALGLGSNAAPHPASPEAR